MAGFRRFAGQFQTGLPQVPTGAAEGNSGRGGRLGGSTAEAQAQGATAQAQNPQLFKPGTSPLLGQDIAGLRKQLGIDELIGSINQLRTQQTSSFMPQSFMPQMEVPTFDMSAFESAFEPSEEESSKFNPDEFASGLIESLKGVFGTPEYVTKAGDTLKQEGATKQAANKTFGGLTYNIGKSFTMKDVTNLKSLGAKKGTIAEFASTAKSLDSGTKKELKQMGFNVKPGTQGGWSVGVAPKKTVPATQQKAKEAKDKSQSYLTSSTTSQITFNRPTAAPAPARSSSGNNRPTAAPAPARSSSGNSSGNRSGNNKKK